MQLLQYLHRRTQLTFSSIDYYQVRHSPIVLELRTCCIWCAWCIYLTCAGFIVLARSLDPAGAWAIVGVFWGLVGLIYFAAARRRRG